MSDATTTAPRIKIAWLIGVAVAFVIFAAIAGYSARMTADYTDYSEDRAKIRYDNLKKVQDAENKLINPVDDKGKPTAVWVDQAKGTINIPIDQAMDKELDNLKAKAPAMGNELPAATPAAAPAPAAPATNAAPAEPAPPATNTAPNATTNVTPAAPAAKPPAKPKK